MPSYQTIMEAIPPNDFTARMQSEFFGRRCTVWYVESNDLKYEYGKLLEYDMLSHEAILHIDAPEGPVIYVTGVTAIRCTRLDKSRSED